MTKPTAGARSALAFVRGEKDHGCIVHTPEELRRLWDEGLKSGPGKLSNTKAIKAEARRRIEKRDEQGNKIHGRAVEDG